MYTIRLAVVSLSFALVTGVPATAGVVDSPLPTLGGIKTKHVFTVPGVVSNASLVTVFICTNLDRKNSIQFTVEAFASSGGQSLGNLSSQLVSVGGTGIVATKNLLAYFGESSISLIDSSTVRSARIVATSTNISCTVTVVGEPSDPFPKVAWSLSLIKKKQRGD